MLASPKLKSSSTFSKLGYSEQTGMVLPSEEVFILNACETYFLFLCFPLHSFLPSIPSETIFIFLPLHLLLKISFSMSFHVSFLQGVGWLSGCAAWLVTRCELRACLLWLHGVGGSASALVQPCDLWHLAWECSVVICFIFPSVSAHPSSIYLHLFISFSPSTCFLALFLFFHCHFFSNFIFLSGFPFLLHPFHLFLQTFSP